MFTLQALYRKETNENLAPHAGTGYDAYVLRK